MTRSTARRALDTGLLTLGAVVVAPVVLLLTLYLGTLLTLTLADVIYALSH